MSKADQSSQFSPPPAKPPEQLGRTFSPDPVADRKSVEASLHRERAMLRTLVDVLPDSVYVKDTAGRKTLANPADVRNTGRQTEAEVLGKTDFDLFPRETAERFVADDQVYCNPARQCSTGRNLFGTLMASSTGC